MLYTSNALVEFGMWGLRQLKGAKCLTELSLCDAPDPRDSLLYRLSKARSLALFTHLLLVSSSEDRYVPHHSARMQLCDEAVHDDRCSTAPCRTGLANCARTSQQHVHGGISAHTC